MVLVVSSSKFQVFLGSPYVAVAGFCLQSVGVGAEFLAEVGDMYIHSALQDIALAFPNCIKELLAVKYLCGVLQQEGEQFEFLARGRDVFAVDSECLVGEVDGDFLVGDEGGSRGEWGSGMGMLFLGSTEDGFHAGKYLGKMKGLGDIIICA